MTRTHEGYEAGNSKFLKIKVYVFLMGAASSFQTSSRPAPRHKRELLEALEFLGKHKKVGNLRRDALAEKPLADMLMNTGKK